MESMQINFFLRTISFQQIFISCHILATILILKFASLKNYPFLSFFHIFNKHSLDKFLYLSKLILFTHFPCEITAFFEPLIFWSMLPNVSYSLTLLQITQILSQQHMFIHKYKKQPWTHQTSIFYSLHSVKPFSKHSFSHAHALLPSYTTQYIHWGSFSGIFTQNIHNSSLFALSYTFGKSTKINFLSHIHFSVIC